MRPWSHPDARDGDATILHFAIPSPMTAALGTLPGARAICYHNITPPHYFAPFDPAIARLAWLGRQELATLVDRVDLAFGVSEYNREELDDLGFDETMVVPLLVDTARLTDAPPCPRAGPVARRRTGEHPLRGPAGPEQEDRRPHQAGRALQALRGRVLSFHFRRARRCRSAVRPRDPGDGAGSSRCCPSGSGSRGRCRIIELAAYYRHAHLYVSLSEHEGFCAPLVEAMAMDVPILAYAAAAVPETLGGAGVLFDPKDLEVAAELAGQLIYDERLSGARPSPGSGSGVSTSVVTPSDRRSTACSTPWAPCRPQESHPRENRVHRSTVRRRNPRRVRIPLPAHRRAAGRQPPGRGAHDLRARLRVVAQRVPGRRGPSPRRDGAALPHRAHARHPGVQQILRLDLPSRPWPPGRDGMAEAAGAVGAQPDRVPRAAPRAVRRPDFLHVPVCDDGAGHPNRAVQEPARANRARRAGDPPRHLRGRLHERGSNRLEHRRRAAIRHLPLPFAHRRRGRGRLRSGRA